MALAPADLVDAGDEQVVQAPLVEAGRHHAFDDASDGVPVDAHQPAQRGLVHGGGEPADQVLEVTGEPGPGPGEGDPFGVHPVDRAVDPTQIGSHLETPPAKIEVPPARGHRPGVVASLGHKPAFRARQLPASQLHRHDHFRRMELHVGDGHPGQVHEALEYSGDSHGIGLLGSVGVPAPNLEVPRAGHLCVDPSCPVAPRHRSPKNPTIDPAIGERWSPIALLTAARHGRSSGQGPDRRSERGSGARWARRAQRADGASRRPPWRRPAAWP